MLMVTDSGRQNGAWGGEGVEEGGEEASQPKLVDRDSTGRIDSLCASPTPPPPAASAFSPNFVANLRATKSAPFDFTLIRCRCRTVDEADPCLPHVYQRPDHLLRLKKDFILRAARRSSSPLFFSLPRPLVLPYLSSFFPSFQESIRGVVVRGNEVCRTGDPVLYNPMQPIELRN